MTVTRQALRVYATLEGLKPKSEADVLDALIPFLTPVLEFLDGKVFEPSLLIAGLKKLYGWNITTEVANVFQDRLEAHGYLNKPDPRARIWVVALPDDFERRGGDAYATEVQEAVAAFQAFSRDLNDLLHHQRSDEEALDILVRFLVTLDVSISNGSDRSVGHSELLKDLQPEATHLHADERYLCARFVDHASKTDQKMFEKLTKLASVGMLTEVVQDFVEPSNSEEKSGLTLVLDAPLALAALGVSGQQAQRDVQLNIEAARKLGCSVIVFEESCNEMTRILRTTLNTPRQNRHGPTHMAIVKGQVTEQFVGAVQRDPEKALRQNGITVRQITLASMPSLHVHFPDRLFEEFHAAINWRQGYPEAVRHDATVMALTCRLREGGRATDIFENKFVFVTNNGAFTRLARGFAIDHGIVQERHCPPVVQHSALAVAAWLRTGFGAISEIPMAHLLAYCERVLNVKKEVVDRAREVLRKYTPEQEQQYDLLLQDARSVTRLMDFTLGDEDRLTETTVPHLLEEMRLATAAELTEKHQQELEVQRKARSQERETANKERSRLARELSALQAKLEADELDRVQGERLERLRFVGLVEANNTAMGNVRHATTTSASVVALVLIANAIFGWVDWQQDQPVLYWVGTSLGIYGALQQFVGWPTFGFGSLLNWYGRRRLQRRVEQQGLVQIAAKESLTWSYGKAALGAAPIVA
ncbi:hypothetical protein [Devosia elaeis]|uniref:Uncharacterized protein n=1 Tax=Devosia elaeis TaxID=1770058 RepID=A0A178HN67_9HYPH|nr:hypothetical protein [Devosia elaeis]OAM73880.1 hypothetical protein A3840_17105 [Devosia elaeis]